MVIIHKDNKKSIISVFDELRTVGLPAIQKMAFYARLTDMEGEYKFMVRIVSLADGTLPDSKTTDLAQEVPSNPNPVPQWLLTLPDQLQFAGTVDPRLKIDRPFAVTVQRTDGRVIAEILGIEEFGVGASLGEALEDLGKTVAELYLTLKVERAAVA